MAELDGFQDPAADFLAREKEDLGELVDETLGGGQDVIGVSYLSVSNTLKYFTFVSLLFLCGRFQGETLTGEGTTEDIFGISVRFIDKKEKRFLFSVLCCFFFPLGRASVDQSLCSYFSNGRNA